MEKKSDKEGPKHEFQYKKYDYLTPEELKALKKEQKKREQAGVPWVLRVAVVVTFIPVLVVLLVMIPFFIYQVRKSPGSLKDDKPAKESKYNYDKVIDKPAR